MFFRGSLLISVDLMHEIKNSKDLKIDGARIPVTAAHFTYLEQKLQINSEIGEKAPNVVC